MAGRLEGYRGGRMIDEADELDYLSQAFDHARARALTPEKSRQLVASVRHEMLMAAGHPAG
jgi:hypothetical protein